MYNYIVVFTCAWRISLLQTKQHNNSNILTPTFPEGGGRVNSFTAHQSQIFYALRHQWFDLEMIREPSHDIYHSRRVYRHQRIQKVSKAQVVIESIKTVCKEYCAESSICGLKHLVDSSTPYVERIIWIVIMIGALACSVSLVGLTFNRYYMAPLVTTQLPEGISVSEIIFPAVGICTTNRISKNAVTELARQLLMEPRNLGYNESELLRALYGLGQFYDLQLTLDGNSEPTRLHHILGDYDVKGLLKKLTPNCEDILVKCMWNEVESNCSELMDFRLTMNGFCCTFNYQRLSDDFDTSNSEYRNINMYDYGRKSSFDYDQGLKMILRLDKSDDFYYNLPLQGAQLQFSDAYDFPDAPSGSFAVQLINPAAQMTVLVSAAFTEASRDIEHVPVKVRGCLFYDESSYLPFYTHSDCLLKCRMLFLVANCNCTPFNMPNLPTVRTCHLEDLLCLRKYYAQSIAVRPDLKEVPSELELQLVEGGIPCHMCFPTCSKTAYSFEFNNVIIYPENLNAAHSDLGDWLRGVNFTGASIVHIKYASEVADCYGQNVIMKWFDLISNIGSTCGFVTGFSFVSVLEFIYFFTVKLMREIRTQELKKRVEDITHRLPTVASTPLSLGSLTRYRPIYWNELAGNNTRLNHN